MQARIDQIRKEAKELIPLLTTDECHGLLAETLPPLPADAGKTYRAVHQVLSDTNTNDESKKRADIFREELQRHIDEKSSFIRAINLLADDTTMNRLAIELLIDVGSKEDASEADKMVAVILSRDALAPELYSEVLFFIADYLKPSETALRALDIQTALKHIKKEDSLSESEKQLALEAKDALRDESQFAQCSHFFRYTMQFNLKRLLKTLSYHVKRGNLTLVGNVLKSFYEDKKTEDKALLLKLLTATFNIEAYPGKPLTLMQLAYLEKNGRMCQEIKAAFMQFPDGIQLMQAQLSDPFIQTRSQQETPYDFTALITALTTNTNVEAELVKFREDLAVIIAERGFPLTIFSQIIDIYKASWNVERVWTSWKYDILFVSVFGFDGGAQYMSPDWLMRAFAAGIVNKNKSVPGALGDRPFALKGSANFSIDPILHDPASVIGHDYFVNVYGELDGGSWRIRAWVLDGWHLLTALLNQNAKELAELIFEITAENAKDCFTAYRSGKRAAQKNGAPESEETRSEDYRIAYRIGYLDQLGIMKNQELDLGPTAVKIRECFLGFSSGSTHARRGQPPTHEFKGKSPSYIIGYHVGFSSELEKMHEPAPDLYGDAIVFVADYLKPSQAALDALARRRALERIWREDSLSEPERQLALEAEDALRDQSCFAQCSSFFRQTIQFHHKRLLDTLSYQVKRGNLTLVGNVLKSFYEDKKTEGKEIEDKILLLKLLLTETFTIEAYPGRPLTLMQLAYLEKNGQMCQVIKEAFKQLPDGIKLMQEQLNDPFTKSRSQEETPYDFTALVTAITTDTNVEAELVKFREDLAVIIADRGFPLSIFIQIIDIYIATWDQDQPWRDAQYDFLFIQVFGFDGGAQFMSPDWLKRAFAAGIVNEDKKDPSSNGYYPFVLEYPKLISIDPVLHDSTSIAAHSYFVNVYGIEEKAGRGRWGEPGRHGRNRYAGRDTLKSFLELAQQKLNDLLAEEDHSVQEELIAPPPRASRAPS